MTVRTACKRTALVENVPAFLSQQGCFGVAVNAYLACSLLAEVQQGQQGLPTRHTHALSGAAQVESLMSGSPRKALAVLLPTDHGAA